MSAVPPLTLQQVTERAIDPAMRLLPPRLDTREARLEMLAIGLVESGFRDRRQIVMVLDRATGHQVARPVGPAKSFWMGERGGGLVHGVRTHPATRDLARALYVARKVRATDLHIWNAIEHDDILAAGLARLLLFSDPRPMPPLGSKQKAWEIYYGVWKPGRPRRDAWSGHYDHALEFIRSGLEDDPDA